MLLYRGTLSYFLGPLLVELLLFLNCEPPVNIILGSAPIKPPEPTKRRRLALERSRARGGPFPPETPRESVRWAPQLAEIRGGDPVRALLPPRRTASRANNSNHLIHPNISAEVFSVRKASRSPPGPPLTRAEMLKRTWNAS